MKYKNIDIMQFPKTEEGKKVAEMLESETRFVLTEKEDCYELRAESEHEVNL